MPFRQVARIGLRVVAAVVGLVVVYLAVTFGQVWWASRRDQARPVQAIVVLGAAQYSGRPSPVLRARLDHATDLWRRHLAPVVVVTGGRQPGDKFTEATASADYLITRGVPDAQILREVSGRSTWDSLAAASRFLHQRGIDTVLLVSDPFHSERLIAIAGELSLHGYASPTRTSPIRGWSALPYFGRETFAVAAGRIVGFRRLMGIERRV
jgi:vancomycin permeability regulator SanA